MSRVCCIPGCYNTNYTKEVRIFTVPHGAKTRGYNTKEWAAVMKALLFKYRSPNNANFKQKIENGRAFICSTHFKETDIVKSSKRSWLKCGVLPSQHLPKRNHEISRSNSRRIISKCEPSVKFSSTVDVGHNYSQDNLESNFAKLSRIVCNSLPSSWKLLALEEDEIQLALLIKRTLIDPVKLIIHSDLTFHAALNGVPVPRDSLPPLDINHFDHFLQTVGEKKLCSGYYDVWRPQDWICIHQLEANCYSFPESSKRFLSKQCKVAVGPHEKNICPKCTTSRLKEKFNAAVAEERRALIVVKCPSKKLKNLKSPSF